ncbi:MAG: alpha/beta hydrolase [Micrococcales bacterium]|nr:alpha/beta hydrolase [Micrococcales bacterium]MCL2668377.1 alpha/beta hydrolase [Micrococcales bacterium]
MNTKTFSPVILVPGWWLGGWAWDEVTQCLSRDGVPTQAVTLPGLDSPTTPRCGIVLADHVGALVSAVRSATSAVVLVAHSGAGAVVTAALDDAPDLVAQVVYVDSGPAADGTVARPDLSPEAVEVPLPPFAELDAVGASTAELTEQMLRRFHDRAVPHPAGPLREPLHLRNLARNQVPATVVCCSFPSAAVRDMAASGTGMFAPLADLADAHYVDLPTGHWPMWSQPEALAAVIAQTARG